MRQEHRKHGEEYTTLEKMGFPISGRSLIQESKRMVVDRKEQQWERRVTLRPSGAHEKPEVRSRGPFGKDRAQCRYLILSLPHPN